MKKIILLLIVVSSIQLTAQNLTPIKFGIVSGVTVNDFIFTPIEGNKSPETVSPIGINAGIVIQFPLKKKWILNSEILYTNVKTNSTFYGKIDSESNRTNFTSESEYDLTYVVLNPDISYQASNNFFLNFGPSFQYPLSGEISTTETYSSNLYSTSNLKNELSLNDFDFGINVGCSFLVSEKTKINLKVYNGFMSVENKDSSEYKKYGANLSLVYLF
jgi:hypothetical protein